MLKSRGVSRDITIRPFFIALRHPCRQAAVLIAFSVRNPVTLGVGKIDSG